MRQDPDLLTTIDSMSLREKITFIQNVSLFPALTIIVFLRRKLGFRQLSTTRLWVMALILWFVGYSISHPSQGLPYVSSGQNPAGGYALMLYALAFLGYGLFQRWQRWEDLKSGVRWHSRTMGLSWFEDRVPFPPYVVHRWIDPGLAMVAGLVLVPFLPPLGLWLMFSAASLAIFEQASYEKALERDLDTLDGLLEAEIQQETVKHFSGSPAGRGKPRPLTLEETAGIPTGVAPDIAEQIAKRRARRQAAEKAEARAEESASQPIPIASEEAPYSAPRAAKSPPADRPQSTSSGAEYATATATTVTTDEAPADDSDIKQMRRRRARRASPAEDLADETDPAASSTSASSTYEMGSDEVRFQNRREEYRPPAQGAPAYPGSSGPQRMNIRPEPARPAHEAPRPARSANAPVTGAGGVETKRLLTIVGAVVAVIVAALLFWPHGKPAGGSSSPTPDAGGFAVVPAVAPSTPADPDAASTPSAPIDPAVLRQQIQAVYDQMDACKTAQERSAAILRFASPKYFEVDTAGNTRGLADTAAAGGFPTAPPSVTIDSILSTKVVSAGVKGDLAGTAEIRTYRVFVSDPENPGTPQEQEMIVNERCQWKRVGDQWQMQKTHIYKQDVKPKAAQ